MFNKILIANRGEIAVRVIRACKELGIKTVAIYSDVDKNALHVKMADEAVCIGGALSRDSYLNMNTIINTAVLLKAEAIHPGFGFLSENSKFAKMCEDCNIKFIGPSAETIGKMGNKSYATNFMKQSKIPVIPSDGGTIFDLETARKVAKKIGFPVMIKASSGGGGKGMRIVKNKKEFDNLFLQAQEESRLSFADDAMYIEKYIENPKHIEVQVLGDQYGNVISLGLRDCSMQRNNQKVVEESASNIIDDKLKQDLSKTAVKIAKLVKYEGAGTIEFLVSGKDFYFMEMNTRIQVEHPVSEMMTGIDLVKWQIKVAAGERLDIKQKEVNVKCHAIECRINAEDTERRFMPQPGKIKGLVLPGGMGVRVDTAVYDGYKIPPTYDSMLIKIITYAEDRKEAIEKMQRALNETYVGGIKTNRDFLIKLITSEKFQNATYTTSYINEIMHG